MDKKNKGNSHAVQIWRLGSEMWLNKKESNARISGRGFMAHRNCPNNEADLGKKNYKKLSANIPLIFFLRSLCLGLIFDRVVFFSYLALRVLLFSGTPAEEKSHWAAKLIKIAVEPFQKALNSWKKKKISISAKPGKENSVGNIRNRWKGDTEKKNKKNRSRFSGAIELTMKPIRKNSVGNYGNHRRIPHGWNKNWKFQNCIEKDTRRITRSSLAVKWKVFFFLNRWYQKENPVKLGKTGRDWVSLKETTSNPTNTIRIPK